MAFSNQLPQGVPFVDKRGMIDYRWVAFFTSLKQGLAPAGTGYVFDGSATSYAPMTLYQGLESNRPVSPEAGDIYFALDTGTIYFESGGGWIPLSEELTGDVTKPAGSTVTTLSTVFFSPGTYGSASQTPVLTIDGKGRVTDLWFETISATADPVGPDGALQFNNAGAMGGTGQIFYNSANGSLAFSNPAPTRENLSPLLVKGDVFVRNSTASTRLPVGTDGQYLRADSTTATGLSWADDENIEVRFNYGDATPKPLGTIPANRVVRGVTITILEAFNDGSATLSVGDPDDLMTTTDNLPLEAGTYTVVPGTQYLVNTPVTLTISPGTSSQGSGLVTITLED